MDGLLGRNRETNDRVKKERKERIMSEAMALFAVKGLSGTKISDIASAAGISQGLMYHYFGSKEDLFVELIKGAFERMNDACRGLESLDISAREKIKMAIEGLLGALEKSADFARYCLIIAEASVSEAVPEEAREIILRERSKPYDAITRIMKEGQKDGSVKPYDAGDMALIFWTSLNGLAIYKAVHGNRFKAPDPRILTSLFLTETDEKNDT